MTTDDTGHRRRAYGRAQSRALIDLRARHADEYSALYHWHLEQQGVHVKQHGRNPKPPADVGRPAADQ